MEITKRIAEYAAVTDQQVLRPEAQRLIPKVEMHRIPGNEGQPSWLEGYNEVEVFLKDGRVFKEKAPRASSGALRGATMLEVQNKFRDCASLVLPNDVTEELLSLLDNLEELENIGALTDLLRGDGGVQLDVAVTAKTHGSTSSP